MKYICTRACIGKFYGISSLNRTKQTFQIHARDKVRFKADLGKVMQGVIYRNGNKWQFIVPKEVAQNNFGKLEI